MAIACLRLFTVPPLPPRPLLSVPFLRRRIALSTRFDAAFPYLRPPDRFEELFRFAVAIGSLRIELASLTAPGGQEASQTVAERSHFATTGRYSTPCSANCRARDSGSVNRIVRIPSVAAGARFWSRSSTSSD